MSNFPTFIRSLEAEGDPIILNFSDVVLKQSEVDVRRECYDVWLNEIGMLLMKYGILQIAFVHFVKIGLDTAMSDMEAWVGTEEQRIFGIQFQRIFGRA